MALILRKVWACGKKFIGAKKSRRMSLTGLVGGAYIRLTNDGGGAAGGEELRSCDPRVGRIQASRVSDTRRAEADGDGARDTGCV
jgi:hypothetical protein